MQSLRKEDNYKFGKLLIGRHIKVMSSCNKTLENVEGFVIDETKNLFYVVKAKTFDDALTRTFDVKIIQKNVCVFCIDDSFVCDGKDLMFRPHEQIKKMK
jgi:RNase P/RNase MRP subunit p29